MATTSVSRLCVCFGSLSVLFKWLKEIKQGLNSEACSCFAIKVGVVSPLQLLASLPLSEFSF